MDFSLPHRRYNLLTRDWVLVSPHRARRPWLGQVEKVPPEHLPEYDPACYLCPGNERVGGVRNPVYTSTYVFDNDFPALLRPDTAPDRSVVQAPVEGISNEDLSQQSPDPLFAASQEWGINRVVCFSPRHDLSIPEMSQPDVETVVNTWADQTQQLGDLPYIAYVQVFENKGAMMGASNPHPHSQIWAASQVPNEPAKEITSQSAYLQQRGTCLLCDYLAAERSRGERIVTSNDHFTALVPFWAVWPFEVMLLSHRHAGSLPELDGDERKALADIMRRITARYDNLFEVSFPYSMGFHQTPVGEEPHPENHLHAHYYPPLLRSATVRKFMVGYEMLAMPQRDLTPETAAERLRSLSEIHFRSTSQ